MCTEYGGTGTAQSRYKRATGCAVSVSSIVEGDTRHEPQPPVAEAHRLTPRPHDTGSGEIPTSAARERQAKAEGDSRQRCVETADETQAYSGRTYGALHDWNGETGDDGRGSKAGRRKHDRREDSSGSLTGSETESGRRQAETERKRKEDTEETSKVVHC